MSYLSPEYLEDLTVRLCLIPSVSGNSSEENRCADAIAGELKKIAGGSLNPLSVELVPCVQDSLGRNAVLGLLKAAVPTQRTVLLTGHFDVVSTEVCGPLAKDAFDLKHFDKALLKYGISDSIRQEMQSGDWLFGRGSMDMKAGLALFIAAIGDLAADPALAVNILFLAVPDEEANSAGMRGALPALVNCIEENSLEVVAGLTGEPCFWTQPAGESKGFRPYYTGTTGKIMPAFLVIGAEAHVGCYYDGMSAALVLAQIVCRMEANSALLEAVDGDVLSPPACLYMQTRRSVYSVTLPEKGAAYFNVLTVRKTPKDVLDICVSVAKEAAAAAEQQLRKGADDYEKAGGDAKEISSVRVLTADEVRSMAVQNAGGEPVFSLKEKQFLDQQPSELDARELSLRTMEFWAEEARIHGPAVLVGFVPPFYPSRINKRSTPNERRLRAVMEEMTVKSGKLAGDGAVRLTEVFGGITDLSFLGFDGSLDDIEALRKNMPAWGPGYWIPVDDLLKLDVPIANMAGAGKDAHKATERLEKRFSFTVAPKLLLETIEKLSERS